MQINVILNQHIPIHGIKQQINVKDVQLAQLQIVQQTEPLMEPYQIPPQIMVPSYQLYHWDYWDSWPEKIDLIYIIWKNLYKSQKNFF